MASGSGSDAAARIGVVTVSFGSEGVLPAMLASIPDAVAGPFEAVVVDNRPSDDSVRRLAESAGARYLSR
ncbi:MAG: hypothetical protein ABI566_08990, partial [Pseudolysinimonas sp.]